jgi:signal transduction histidine kinase
LCVIVGTSASQAVMNAARAHQQGLRRWVRLVGPLIIVLLAVAAAQTSPHPGRHGTGLGVSLAIAAFVVGALGSFGSRRGPLPVHAACVGLVLVGAAGLVWLQSGGPGVGALFIAMALIARRLPAKTGVGLAVAALIFLVLTADRSSKPEIVRVLTGVAMASFYAVALLAQRLWAANQQAAQLLVELESSRDAHARAAALAERQRLARDMHDVLAHSLSGLVLQLDAARLMTERNDERLPDTIERAHQLAKAGLDEARRAIGMLRDDALPGPEQLPALTENFERDTGICCEFTVVGQPPELGSQTRLALYRVAQEALTNVVKHARPERVTVHLAYQPDQARLTVENYSSQRAPKPAATAGHGLTGMRERAELLGGSLTTVVTDTGFRVELEVRP